MIKHIKYKKGFKYQLAETYSVMISITGFDINTPFLQLTPDGLLTIKSGYAWDGPSGPTIDTLNSMRASLVHDALYQLMRLGLIPQELRKPIDQLFKAICIEDGMSEFRADYWYHGVRSLAQSAADPKNKKKIIIAP